MIQVSDAEFDRVVERAVQQLPAEFHDALENVAIEVHEQPSARDVPDRAEADALFGLYLGEPLTEQSHEAPLPGPHRILIFKRNLCAACGTVAELQEEIRITVLHEIGHHFGLDEDQLEDLGYD